MRGEDSALVSIMQRKKKKQASLSWVEIFVRDTQNQISLPEPFFSTESASCQQIYQGREKQK